MGAGEEPRVVLLEFDERFEVFEEWVRFDFEKPEGLPRGLEGGFDAVLVDPPYHSEDCARKCE
jgi:16S rRNA G966 N2-methylase RsmD